MPGDRKKEKKKVGVWLTEAERMLLKETAEAYSCTESELFRRSVNEAAKRKGLVSVNEKGLS